MRKNSDLLPPGDQGVYIFYFEIRKKYNLQLQIFNFFLNFTKIFNRVGIRILRFSYLFNY